MFSGQYSKSAAWDISVLLLTQVHLKLLKTEHQREAMVGQGSPQLSHFTDGETEAVGQSIWPNLLNKGSTHTHACTHAHTHTRARTCTRAQTHVRTHTHTKVLCLVVLSCSILCNPTDRHLPGSSVQGDSPGKNTGVGCHALLQGIFPTQGSNPGLLHYRQIPYHLSTREAHTLIMYI